MSSRVYMGGGWGWLRGPWAPGLLALALAAWAGAACEAGDGVDLVLRGGVVATVDDNDTMAEALAIDDGWIVAVGSDADVDPLIGAGTRVIELDGRFAAPGFIEGHGHYMSLGNSKTILDLNNVANWDEIVQMVAGAVAEAEPGEWIRGRGWHQEKWDRPPDPGGRRQSDACVAHGSEPGQPGAAGPRVRSRRVRQRAGDGARRLRPRFRAAAGWRAGPRRERRPDGPLARDRPGGRSRRPSPIRSWAARPKRSRPSSGAR